MAYLNINARGRRVEVRKEKNSGDYTIEVVQPSQGEQYDGEDFFLLSHISTGLSQGAAEKVADNIRSAGRINLNFWNGTQVCGACMPKAIRDHYGDGQW